MKLCDHSRLFFLVLALVVDITLAFRESFKIGGIFETSEGHLQKAFTDAIEIVNKPSSTFDTLHLEPIVETVGTHDSFQTYKKVCNMIENGVVAIFGPQSEVSAAHVQSIASALEIPHLEIRWDFKFHRRNYSINLHPHPSSLSMAFFDLINDLRWKSFSIIYEGNEGLVRMQELLKGRFEEAAKIIIRKVPDLTEYRIMLKEIKMLGETKIVLDCSPEKTLEILKQAQEIGMVNYYFSYIITSLDMHAMDLESFQNTKANITGFRIVNPEKAEAISKFLMTPFNPNYVRNQRTKIAPLKTAEALVHDGVSMFATFFARAISGMSQVPFPPLSCNVTSKRFELGHGIVQLLRIETMSNGVTGNVRFDELGRRQNYTLDIIMTSPNGFNKIGTWHSTDGLKIIKNFEDTISESRAAMENITLRVTTKLSKPFVMEKADVSKYAGNERYEGYCIDLMNEIAKELKLNYTIQIVKDNKHGNIDEATGKWNGMIKELIDQEADLAIGDLTMNVDRETVVDFTMPFMNLGISILFKKPIKNPPYLFSFMSPLSGEVWMYMATAYLGVSIILFLLARMSPFEWLSPHPCDPDPEELENIFSLSNCIWFTIGSLMQQGCDFLPKAVSTRILAGIWWFFTLIMISSYTANLAAFLTSERLANPIESVDDLAAQNTIKYGCMDGGSTKKFFAISKTEPYRKMYKEMQSTSPTVYTNDNDEGVQRVRAGNYAYFIESTTNEYYRERYCELTQIGGLLDAKSYGIATPPGSKYRTHLSQTITLLQERAILTELKEKWWRRQKPGDPCETDDKKSAASASELGLYNVGGVFAVLLGGMVLACVVGVMEFVWKTRKTVQEERGDFWEEFRSEINFSLNCRSNKKPVRKTDNKDGMSLPLTNDS